MEQSPGVLQRTVKALVAQHQPNMLGLLETKCSGDHADKICNQIGFDDWIRVELDPMEEHPINRHHQNSSTVHPSPPY